jgi:DNA-binding transcriptional MerR regulator
MSRHEGDPEVRDEQQLVSALQALHRQAGKPSFRTIAKSIGTVSHTTVSEALSGRRIPSWPIVQSITQYLHGNENEIQHLWLASRETSAPVTDPTTEHDFLARYRRNAAIYYGSLDTAGTGTRVRVPIADVYVSPVLTPLGDTTDNRIDPTSAVNGVDHLVLLGGPGSGKTITGHALMYEYSTTDGNFVPFLIPVREFALGPSLSHSIVGFVEQRLATVFQCQPPEGALSHILVQGSALVIFDGFDEVIDAERHDQIASAIELFCVEYPDVRVVVTSRPVGYDRRPLDPTIFSTFRLENFDDGRVRRLVIRTLSATTPGLSPDDMDDVAEGFMRDTAPLADIRTNPAFLALALSLYEGRGSLPLNLADLYGELLERMLGGSGDAGRVVRYFLPSTIGYLAFWLISERNDQSAVAEHKLVALVADYLRSRVEDREEAGDVAQGLVRYLRDRSGLLHPVGITSDGERLYTFLHRSFMEYSAATHLAATVAGPDDLAAELAERLTETQWFDVGLFTILIVDRTIERGAERVIRTLLEKLDDVPTEHQVQLEDFLRQCAELTYLPHNLTHQLRALFDKGASMTRPAPTVGGDLDGSEFVGYLGPTACQIAGVTYRQLDYWVRTGLVAPSIRVPSGQRLYSFKDILILKVVKRLLDTGVALSHIRIAVEHLRPLDIRDVEKVTLFSDGETVYEANSPEKVVELLQGGRGVFGIAVSGVLREVRATIHEYSAERQDHATPNEPAAARYA